LCADSAAVSDFEVLYIGADFDRNPNYFVPYTAWVERWALEQALVDRETEGSSIEKD
jgi:hypothetical protein